MSIDGVSGTKHGFDPRSADEQLSVSNDAASQTSPTADDGPGTSLLLVDGDMAAQIAALAILSAQKQREANRDIQGAEEAALERAEDAQVKALRDKAEDTRIAGLADGAFGMCGGALTIGGGVASDDSEKQFYRGGATMSEAGGKAVGGLFRADQIDDQARADMHDHEAGHHHRNLDAARDAVREGQDFLERALDFYKQSQQSEADAFSSSLRRG